VAGQKPVEIAVISAPLKIFAINKNLIINIYFRGLTLNRSAFKDAYKQVPSAGHKRGRMILFFWQKGLYAEV
jgi:hypothetical protein